MKLIHCRQWRGNSKLTVGNVRNNRRHLNLSGRRLLNRNELYKNVSWRNKIHFKIIVHTWLFAAAPKLRLTFRYLFLSNPHSVFEQAASSLCLVLTTHTSGDQLLSDLSKTILHDLRPFNIGLTFTKYSQKYLYYIYRFVKIEFRTIFSKLTQFKATVHILTVGTVNPQHPDHHTSTGASATF